MARVTFVWITTRDGSLHATLPPIMAAAQPMLCGRSYGRRDLRVGGPSSTEQIPPWACPGCRDRVLAAGGAKVRMTIDRKPPMWP